MKTIYLLFAILFLTSCSEEATLNSDYWETIEAGAYKFTSAKKTTYINGVFASETPIVIGNSYALLETTNYGGFHNNISFYGDWTMKYKTYIPDGWNMENDSKRLTFVSYIAGFDETTATLTIDNVGEQSQTWHFVDGNATTYNHYTYTLERTSKPN
jgi:hypothetical protein